VVESTPTEISTPIIVEADSTIIPTVITPTPTGPSADELAQKKRKLDETAAVESKKRSRRMFGLLQGTLNQAKEQTKSMSGTTKRRQELEDKLTMRLKAERVEMEGKIEEKRELQTKSRDLSNEIAQKEAELSTLDALVRRSFSFIHSPKINQ
jgi:hypothetical protein